MVIIHTIFPFVPIFTAHRKPYSPMYTHESACLEHIFIMEVALIGCTYLHATIVGRKEGKVRVT